MKEGRGGGGQNNPIHITLFINRTIKVKFPEKNGVSSVFHLNFLERHFHVNENWQNVLGFRIIALIFVEGQSSFKGKGNLRICSELLEICRFKGDGSNVDLNFFFFWGGGTIFLALLSVLPSQITSMQGGKKASWLGFFFCLVGSREKLWFLIYHSQLGSGGWMQWGSTNRAGLDFRRTGWLQWHLTDISQLATINRDGRYGTG